MRHEGEGTDSAPTPAGDREGPTRYTWRKTDSPSTAIVRAVAAATGRDPIDLPRLYDRVDGDALDALLSRGSNPGNGVIRVSFAYAGVEVAIDTDARIEVTTDGAARE